MRDLSARASSWRKTIAVHAEETAPDRSRPPNVRVGEKGPRLPVEPDDETVVRYVPGELDAHSFQFGLPILLDRPVELNYLVRTWADVD